MELHYIGIVTGVATFIIIGIFTPENKRIGSHLCYPLCAVTKICIRHGNNRAFLKLICFLLLLRRLITTERHKFPSVKKVTVTNRHVCANRRLVASVDRFCTVAAVHIKINKINYKAIYGETNIAGEKIVITPIVIGE